MGFPELLTQLRISNRLLAAGLKSNMKQNQLIALLASTGATNKEIADVLDTTPATVSVAIQRMKKKSSESNSNKAESEQPSDA
ncbi:MAG: LuxR C-terminal-related transcriptional regulator [Planctomycetota bacterium]